MTTLKILLVEDEESLASFIQTELELEGYSVIWAQDGEEALTFYEKYQQDLSLILLDWMLPVYDGITVARRIRKKSDIPIIMMTARNETRDIVIGLDTGLDDYLTKPFEIEELFARIRVIQRRMEQQEKTIEKLNFEGLAMDISKHQLSVGSEIIELTPKEFGVLYLLMKEPDIVKTREELLNDVWGYDYFGQTNVVDVYIRTLRNKLAPVNKDKMIQTIRGVGYVLRK
ncbi:MAG: response regulator transcription factor [Vagococcus sp.]|uniref:response regulator transcription factor n=1 Tax=Vagococcus TaxID=2737 RepID=UPI002FCA1F1E